MILLAVLGLLLVSFLAAYWVRRQNRFAPRSVLTQREIKMIADQLDVRFVAAPIAITTWLSYDAAYSLHARVDFRRSGPTEPVEARWFTPSNQASPADAVREFWSPVPDFVARAAEQWQAIPMMPGDVVYCQSRKETGPVGS
ncbi:MAG: hypothetical protein GX616_03035, partial [Planctomycetes bacterium]|nr:hypothetical protein [Planctomycetota bacterium]